MKYQIYLNKETSDIVERIARASNKKSARVIKEMFESMLRISKNTAEQLDRELKLLKESQNGTSTK